jgi:hypothetical protein
MRMQSRNTLHEARKRCQELRIKVSPAHEVNLIIVRQNFEPN